MKSNVSRVFAWIFFALMLLSACMLAVSTAFYITQQDWMPYEFIVRLPFAIPLDYVLLNAAVTILLLFLMILFFALARRRARKNREAAEAAVENNGVYYLEEPLSRSCSVAPVAQKKPARDDWQAKVTELMNSETVQKVAKIAIPVVGACVIGALVASNLRNREKAKHRREFYRWLG